MFQVFLGPDGVGKSAVIHELRRSLPSEYSDMYYMHLRPDLFKRSKKKPGRNNNKENIPYARPPRSFTQSIIRLLTFMVDYGLARMVVFPRLRRDRKLIVFDRYIYDFLVDPARYRYGGPRWIVNLCCRLAPRPEHIFVFDAPAKVIHERKVEQSIGSIFHLSHRYRKLATQFDQAMIVNADQPLAKVVEEIKSILGAKSAVEHPRQGAA